MHDTLTITIQDAYRLEECYGLEVSVPSDYAECTSPSRVHNGLGIVPQIWGMISVEQVFQGCPPVLQAHCVPSDVQRMCTHDPTLCAIRGAEDESSNS